MKSHWRRGVCLALALAAAPAIRPGDARSADPAGPVAEVPETVFDIGTVYPKEQYVHTFVVRNTGKADLVIADVKPG